ncbi:MAG: hypothetical protein ACOY3Y_07460 [Acidobacteriota bacterium]
MTRLLALLTLLLVIALGACGDSAVSPTDATPPDAGVDHAVPKPDQKPTPVGPMANVYKVSPLADKKVTSQVMLKGLSSKDGALTGSYANVWNCVAEEGGQPINVSFGGMKVSGSLCVMKQQAKPGADESYLHIKPAATDTDGKSSFPEVMMYHHLATIGSYYKESFGLSHVAKPLRAIVNLQGYGDLSPLGLPLKTWIGVPNAAYMPKEAADELKKLIGVDILNGEEAIVFGYNNLMPTMPATNYSLDALVIYHEYTHFTIGAGRLLQSAADALGVDPSPKGLNEALADYLSCSFVDTPKMGEYALGSQSRDLTRTFKCPDHLIGEEHQDGEIMSGALWKARAAVGAKDLDLAIWKAVLTFNLSTTFEQGANAILAELKKIAPGKETVVETIFKDQGVIGCNRLVEHKDYDNGANNPLSPTVDGKATAQAVFAKSGVPGPLQYSVAIKDTTKEIAIQYVPSSGGMFGVGGARGNVWIALKKGGAPIQWDYATGDAVSDAQKTLKGADDGATAYKLTLSGSCISKGTLVFQLVNDDLSPNLISSLKVTQSDTVSNPTPNFDGCP